MENSLTISFTCSTNTATLLMTLYEILAAEPLNFSILVPDNFAWLVDEIASRAEEALEIKIATDEKGFQEESAATAIIEFEQKRRLEYLTKTQE